MRFLPLIAMSLSLFAMSANAILIPLVADIDGAQEVPQVGAAGSTQADIGGSGFATLLFDDVTNVLSWSIDYSLETGPAVAAHFHGPTEIGEVGGVGIANAVRFSIPGIPGTSAGTNVGSFDLDDLMNPAPNVDNLLAGFWYINIHTDTFPSGEIRGQVLQQVPEPMTLALFGLGLAGLLAGRRRSP